MNGRICARRHVAGGFDEAAAAGTHLVIPPQPVEDLRVWRLPQGDRSGVLVGSGVFSGTVWARDGRGSEDRDVPVPAVGHDLRYVYAVRSAESFLAFAANTGAP